MMMDTQVVSEQSTATLQVEGLECIRNDMVLFSGLDFTLQSGEVIQVDGPNGCGKTSLLRIVCGLAQPGAGSVCWSKTDINEDNSEFLTDISYVGHHNGIKLELTALENLDIAQVLAASRFDASPVQALREFGLAGYEHTPARKMSSGQKRRVALSRLLLTRARLWVLDEPFTSVDEAGKKIIQGVIEKHLDAGGMLLLATHEPMQLTTGKFTRLLLKQWS